VFAFDHEGRLVQFDTWLDDLQLYLLSDSEDSVSLFDLASIADTALPATANRHAVVARYSSPATAALGRLLLPYLFPELSAFTTVEDLLSHLRASDARYRAAIPAEFLDRNPPPILLGPYTNTPSPLAPSYASTAAADVSVPEDVGAASASAKRRSSKGKGGQGGSGGSGGGGCGSGSGGGGSSGGGGGGGTGGGSGDSGGGGGGSGGSGGGGGGSGGSGGSGGGGTGGSGTSARRVGSGGGQRQQQQRRSKPCLPTSFTGRTLRGTSRGPFLHCPPVFGSSVWLTVRSSPPLVLYELGSSLYTLATKISHVAASAQVSASGQVAASCSCRLLSHRTLLWYHRLGHPSLPRLRGVHSRLLISGLPRSLPPLPPLPAPPCLLCIEGQQRTAPHSSSFPPTTAPLQTLHMDVWGPARVSGQSRERYFLLIVDDYTRYTTVFPLRSKGQDLPVLRLHSDRGGEFCSDFFHGEGILQSFTLPDSPQQNGIAERRIGLVMEVVRTSIIHVAAPQFLWPFAFRYVAHQLNLWPRVSLPQTSPTLCWTGEVGDASVFRVWGSREFVNDTSADKLSPRVIP
ncbi:unnamed protein product, partial [Closterium sp. NIES-53]